MNKVILSHDAVYEMVKNLEYKIRTLKVKDIISVYPVPRGGVPVAYLMDKNRFRIAASPESADVIIDDIVDSGSTKERYLSKYPDKLFVGLIDKDQDNIKDLWVVFPWESSDSTASITDSVIRMLQYIGENPSRGGLLETPSRVVKAWDHWFGGYDKDPVDLLKVFDDGAENYDQMVTVKDIPIYSHCEHHLAPIFGTATISYIPNGKIVGLSKLSRLADIYSRRLQVQERLTDQIADALNQNLKPLGVGVIIKARHLCMESRGICQQGHQTITTALRGVIKEDVEARNEFLRLI